MAEIKKSTPTEINPQSGNFLTLYIDISDNEVYVQDDFGIRGLLSDYLPSVTSVNIYNSDGVISEDRTLGGANLYTLQFNALKNFFVTTAESLELVGGNFVQLFSNNLIQFQSKDNAVYADTILQKTTNTAKIWSENIDNETQSFVQTYANGILVFEATDRIEIWKTGSLLYQLPTSVPNDNDVLTGFADGTTQWLPSSASSFTTYNNYSDGKKIGTYSDWTYLDSLGYTSGVSGTAATTWTRTALAYGVDFYDNINQWTIDAVAMTEAHLAMEEQGGPTELYSGNRGLVYYVDMWSTSTVLNGITLPRLDTRTQAIQQFKIVGNNALVLTGPVMHAAAMACFIKKPKNQTDADNLFLDCVVHMEDFVIRDNVGYEGRATTGIEICATNSFYGYNLKCVGFGVGFYSRFLLGAEFNKCLATNCFVGFKNRRGDWTGTTSSNTVSQITWLSCRADCLDSGRGWDLTDCDNSNMYACWGEGSTGDAVDAMVVWDQDDNSVIKNFTVRGFRCEMECTEAVFYLNGGDFGTAQIEQVYNVKAETLVSLNNIGGTNTVNLKNCNINTVPWNLANQGNNNGAWIFENVYLPGDGSGNFPVTPAQIVDTVAFPDVWRTGTSPIGGGAYTVPDASQPPYRVQIPIVRPL